MSNINITIHTPDASSFRRTMGNISQETVHAITQKIEGGLMGLTTDRTDPSLHNITEGGQQEKYLVLSEEERARGFERPVRTSYTHKACGAVTTMNQAIAETYARDHTFYTGTFCSHCRQHFPLVDRQDVSAFTWIPDGSPVGS